MMGIVTKTDFRHNNVMMWKQRAAKDQREEDGKTGLPVVAGGKRNCVHLPTCHASRCIGPKSAIPHYAGPNRWDFVTFNP
jgi:hypothetical protein